MAILCVEPHVQKRLAGVSLHQRHEQTADERIVVNAMPVLAHDTDDFHVVRRSVFRRVGVTNVLPDRVFVRKKFFAISSSIIATRRASLFSHSFCVKSRPRSSFMPSAS